MAIDEIKAIQSKIREKNLSWSAGTTSLSNLPKEAWKNYLGLVVLMKKKRGPRS